MCEQFWTRFLAYYPHFAPRSNVQHPSIVRLLRKNSPAAIVKTVKPNPAWVPGVGGFRAVCEQLKCLVKKEGGLHTIGKGECLALPIVYL